jgi:hypothetical protein
MLMNKIKRLINGEAHCALYIVKMFSLIKSNDFYKTTTKKIQI